MSIRLTRLDAYADLGDVWLRDQLARLTQKGGKRPARTVFPC